MYIILNSRERHFSYWFLGSIIALTCAILFLSSVEAQTNHPYPRTGIFQWGGAPAEWYAKFDLNMTRITSASFISQVKQLNPNTLWMPMRDFNRANEFISNFPEEWFLHDSKGNRLNLYGPDSYWADLSDLCPKINNKNLGERFAEILAQIVESSGSDGIATDGLYYRLHLQYNMWPDIDLDRNGKNDLTEAGKGKQWVINHWGNGVDQFLANLRAELGENKTIMINTGSSDIPGATLINGYVSEHVGNEYNWQYTRSYFNNVFNKARQPHTFLANHNTDGYDPNRVHPSKNDFPYVRFGLGRAMLLGQYYEFEDNDQHFWNRYYDEFDLDIGLPTTDMQILISTGTSGKGVWTRFFDKGVVIVNLSGQEITVTNEELSQLYGYNGVYYRFKGGQDPTFNNGQLFNQITLRGYNYNTYGGLEVMGGDAIILVKNPTVAVSDIIIDNTDSGTSPGSDCADLTNGWTKEICDNGGAYYTLRCGTFLNSLGFAYVSQGSGSETATFQPNIGIAGEYEVFEWHGYLGSSPSSVFEATNVPHTIVHANGTSQKSVNQAVEYGKWNSLGVYYFNRGKSGYVRISNNANGTVLADAMKFVYRGSTNTSDTISPNEPRALHTQDVTQNSITLAWSPPLPASDGDVASFYKLYRDNNYLSYTFNTYYTDSGLAESNNYYYEVKAVDDWGNESENSASGNFSTLSDLTPPDVDLVNAVSNVQIEIVFNEPIETASAENVSNYSINNGITISSASLNEDTKTVQLTTSKHIQGNNYSLMIRNIKDRSVNQNVLLQKLVNYVGAGPLMEVTISVDNIYELWVNGEYIGTDDDWTNAETYGIPLLAGKNVIAVLARQTGMVGGLVAEIRVGENKFVSNNSWVVSTEEYQGWESYSFDDSAWSRAHSYGIHGVAEPWATFRNVDGITANTDVHWIWSSDNVNDVKVYLRFSFDTKADATPPNPPTGVTVKKP